MCGAKNVPAPGGKVAWAPPGATLPGGRKLERKDVRGVSSPGMLCSEVELGISEAGDGILILSPDAPAGAELARHVGLLDEVLEVNVTPNRPDALSHVGIAREVAALFRAAWRVPAAEAAPEIALPAGRGVDIQIRDAAGCPRYNARIITGLAVGQSPLALRVRLAACGMRAISNLVDVTNYVMLETGHPLHAFDLDKLRGGIHVRRANRGERMTTLDGVDRPLQEGDVVIADDRGAIALAGVMGGAESEISEATKDVLLETATFDPRRFAGPRSGWDCTARRRTASSAASTPRASRTRAAAPRRCWHAPAAAPWRGGRRPLPAAARAAAGGAVVRGSVAAGGLRDPLVAGSGETGGDRDCHHARRSRPAQRHDPQLPSRHFDRGGPRRGGHASRRIRPGAGAAAAFQRRARAEPAGVLRSRPRSAGGARPRRDRELGLRAARLAGAAGRAAGRGRRRQEPDFLRL